jgi:hypothetical protein
MGNNRRIAGWSAAALLAPFGQISLIGQNAIATDGRFGIT